MTTVPAQQPCLLIALESGSEAMEAAAAIVSQKTKGEWAGLVLERGREG